MPTGPAPALAGSSNWQNLEPAESKLMALFRELVNHSGFGELKVYVKILRKGKKEVLISSGKEYRFILKPVLDNLKEPLKN